MNRVDADERMSAWDRIVAASHDPDSEWPLVAVLVSLLWEHRRLVARIYGYGVAALCWLLTQASYTPAPRGWPLGLAVGMATMIATDHWGVRQHYRFLHTRAGRTMVYAILTLVAILGLLVLPPASH